MLDVRLAQLRHFLLIVETKSFRVAAKRAFRSQPALSQSIRQLEARLGQPLFEDGSRTTLTPFGESCLPVIRELVAHIDRATQSMLHVAEVSGGRLSIAIVPSVAGRWLPSLLRTFVTRYPEVEIKVLAEDSHNVHRLVAESEVDFGISSFHDKDPKITYAPLIHDQFGLLCRSDHPFAKARQPISWEQLRGQPILGNAVHRALVDTPAAEFVAKPRIHVSNLATLLRLVEEGLGITPVPALASAGTPERLAFVPLAKPVLTRTSGIMTLAGRSLLPAAQAIVDLMKSQLRADEAARAPSRLKSMVKIAAGLNSRV
ncbi:MAG: LysR family transcriptional regulator [Burkholderiales bacterium]